MKFVKKLAFLSAMLLALVGFNQTFAAGVEHEVLNQAEMTKASQEAVEEGKKGNKDAMMAKVKEALTLARDSNDKKPSPQMEQAINHVKAARNELDGIAKGKGTIEGAVKHMEEAAASANSKGGY